MCYVLPKLKGREIVAEKSGKLEEFMYPTDQIIPKLLFYFVNEGGGGFVYRRQKGTYS